MWLDNQQVQSMFQVNFVRLNWIWGLSLAPGGGVPFADCPEMAQTVLQLNIWSGVQDISQCLLLFALVFGVSPVVM